MDTSGLDDFFPINFFCDPKTGQSEYYFRDIFLKEKPEELIWYSYDVIILSPTLIEFVVYGMQSSLFGGVGDELLRLKVLCDLELIRRPITEHALKVSRFKLEVLIEVLKTRIAKSYATELLDKIYPET